MRQTYLKISFVFLPLLSIWGCDKNGYDVDVSKIDADIKIVRFEDRFFTLSDDEFDADYEQLYQDNPLITEVMVEQIIGAGRADQPRFSVIKRFTSDSINHQIADDVLKAYPNVEFIKKDLDEAFKHVKYYFPEDTIPDEAYTVVTRFAGPGFTYKGIIGISLDWYMGEDYEYYHPQLMPKYMQRRMSREYIVPQVIKGYFTNKYPIEKYTDGSLLSEMIYYGKLLEFTKMMLPHLDDAMIIEYTAKNMEWCKENERQVFSHFVENKLWFSTDQMQTSRYISDGPYTVAPNVPMESAPRLGWWVGWNIVRNYIDHEGLEHPDVLFANSSAEDIFRKAKYKP